MGDVLLPILKDTKDPHYRYKMPKLAAKVEGSGNGIKTVITNMVAIAKALDRPASYPIKYFGCELGAQVTMNSDYVVNGSHDVDKLQNLLYTFIRRFVLCAKCSNPETSLVVNNKKIRQKCIACGHESEIPKTIHKLTTYIINNPPEGQSSGIAAKNTNGSNGKSSKIDRKAVKATKNSGGNSPTNGGSEPSGNGNGKAHANETSNQNDDFDDQFDDEEFTTQAYSERLRELRGENGGIYLNDPKESANLFYSLVKEKRAANQLADDKDQREIVSEAERLEIKDKSTLILSELLFTDKFFDEIKTHRRLLLRFCQNNPRAQKYLLGGFEKLVGDVYKDTLFNNSLKILKQFYDQDIIDEETIIGWASKESKKYVSKEISRKIREKVAPFIKWLKEAECEEDDDDDDDDEEVTSKSAKSTNKVNGNGSQNGDGISPSNGQRKQSLDDEDEDDDLLEFSHRVTGLHIESVAPQIAAKAINADIESTGKNNKEDDIDIDNI